MQCVSRGREREEPGAGEEVWLAGRKRKGPCVGWVGTQTCLFEQPFDLLGSRIFI